MYVKVIPNFLTLLNLFFGIFAIILLFQQEMRFINLAAIMVIIGMALDGLDGRMARWLNAQSEFGKELDSLSDIVTFGVAPAMIMYIVSLHNLDFAGVLVAAIFPMCGAIRLARFNVQAKKITGYFVGLPITSAGGVLSTLALYHELFSPFSLTFFMLLLSFLMISHIKYPNFKKVGIPRGSLWISAMIITVVVVVAVRFPEEFPKLIFLPLAFYAAYGFIRSLRIFVRRKKNSGEDEYPMDYK